MNKRNIISIRIFAFVIIRNCNFGDIFIRVKKTKKAKFIGNFKKVQSVYILNAFTAIKILLLILINGGYHSS